MPFTTAAVSVSQINPTDWKLTEELVYEGRAQKFTVPIGFVTDFASVPRIFFWLIPSYGAYTKAAILHDFLCHTAVVGRADADGLFLRTLRELDVPFVRRWLMWAAVRFNSRLSGAKPDEVFTWLLVTVPAAIFLIIPAFVVTIWLILLWFIELVLFLILKPFSKKRVNLPKIWPLR
jgi:Protein of unknown function (DUF1353)